MDRQDVLERLNTARAGLLAAIAGLDEATMTTLPVVGVWTIQQVLAHVAGWAAWDLEAIGKIQGGEEPDFAAIEDEDSFNAGVVEARSSWTVAETLAELELTQVALRGLLLAMPEEDLFQVGRFKGPHWDNLAGWLRVAREHEEKHTAQLQAWRTAVATI